MVFEGVSLLSSISWLPGALKTGTPARAAMPRNSLYWSGMLWGLPGDGISGPEHEGRGRIHSLYCTEDIAGNGRLSIARVRWTVVSGQDKDEFACVCWL